MSDDNLMTVEEFDAALKKWEKNVFWIALGNIDYFARKGTGELYDSFKSYIDPIKHNTGRRIAFKFPRHGVFWHYGAGRGYVIINGQPVRGYRVLSLREKAKGSSNAGADELLKRGYSMSHVNRAKKVYSENLRVSRIPIDWLDSVIDDETSKLVDISARFYGDRSIAKLLNQIRKSKIIKVYL